MPPVGAFVLALVAIGLLLGGWFTIARLSGRDPSRLEAVAVLAGVTLALVVRLTPVMPFVAFSLVVGAALAGAWGLRGEWASVGWFLMGAGDFWLLYELWAGLNDLGDAAVSRPGWSPLPLVIALFASSAGAALILVARRRASSS